MRWSKPCKSLWWPGTHQTLQKNIQDSGILSYPQNQFVHKLSSSPSSVFVTLFEGKNTFLFLIPSQGLRRSGENVCDIRGKLEFGFSFTNIFNRYLGLDIQPGHGIWYKLNKLYTIKYPGNELKRRITDMYLDGGNYIRFSLLQLGQMVLPTVEKIYIFYHN